MADVGSPLFRALTASGNAAGTFSGGVPGFVPLTALGQANDPIPFRALTATNENVRATVSFALLTATSSTNSPVSFSPLTVSIAELSQNGLLPMTASGSMMGASSFSPMTASSSERGLPSFSPMTVAARSPSAAVSLVSMTALASDQHIGSGVVSFIEMSSLASERSDIGIAPMSALGDDNKHATGSPSFFELSAEGMGDSISLFSALDAVGGDYGIGSGSASFTPMTVLAFDRGVTSFSPMVASASERDLAQFLPMTANAFGITVGDVIIPENRFNIPYDGWSINYKTGAPSRYKDLPANSITAFNGVTYIANDAGIYALDGDTDAGRNINASIHIPQTDFGSSQEKRVPYVYIGADVVGKLRITPTVNKQKRSYYEFSTSRSAPGKTKGMRAVLGKGLRGRYWSFVIENIDGSDFVIDSVKFEHADIQRHGA